MNKLCLYIHLHSYTSTQDMHTHTLIYILHLTYVLHLTLPTLKLILTIPITLPCCSGHMSIHHEIPSSLGVESDQTHSMILRSLGPRKLTERGSTPSAPPQDFASYCTTFLPPLSTSVTTSKNRRFDNSTMPPPASASSSTTPVLFDLRVSAPQNDTASAHLRVASRNPQMPLAKRPKVTEVFVAFPLFAVLNVCYQTHPFPQTLLQASGSFGTNEKAVVGDHSDELVADAPCSMNAADKKNDIAVNGQLARTVKRIDIVPDGPGTSAPSLTGVFKAPDVSTTDVQVPEPPGSVVGVSGKSAGTADDKEVGGESVWCVQVRDTQVVASKSRTRVPGSISVTETQSPSVHEHGTIRAGPVADGHATSINEMEISSVAEEKTTDMNTNEKMTEAGADGSHSRRVKEVPGKEPSKKEKVDEFVRNVSLQNTASRYEEAFDWMSKIRSEFEQKHNKNLADGWRDRGKCYFLNSLVFM